MAEVLGLKRIRKVYGDTVVLDDLEFAVEDGELRCLLGPNGAGKTTCMDVITGRQRPDGGRVYFDGNDITALSEDRIARLGVGRKFQVPAVFKGLTVRENLQVASARWPDPFINMAVLFRRAHRAKFDEVVALTGLGERLDTTASVLSHGETQWLEIGMVLMQEPRLLLLDEPTAGMTEAETLKTAGIVNGLKGSHTLLVVEHDMAFVREIADIVTVMHQGAVLAQGPIAEVEQDPRVKEVYLGSEAA
ncbi:MAG: urea ABC transporter ATP-binding protein UrtD [Candidatus Competibacterales bacterium]